MREVNLSGLDLNLLPALDALLTARHVSHAATQVGLSQPAMSRALARLRLQFNDPLLRRGQQGLVLTPLAVELRPQVAAAAESLKQLFRPRRFDPGLVTRQMRLAATDSHGVLLLPPLLARLRREAPGVTLQLESYGADLRDRLEDGRLDAAFALASSELPRGVLSMPLAEDRLALVMRRGHPAAGRAWSLADYAVYDHVGVSILGDGRSEIDSLLATAGISRRLALVTPHFVTALASVAATDLVTTLSEALARHFAAAFDLVLQPPPFAATALPMTLVWSRLRDADPMLAWFRSLLQGVAQQVYAAPLAGTACRAAACCEALIRPTM